MDLRISSTLPIREPSLAQPAPAPVPAGAAFQNVFANVLESVNADQTRAQTGIERFLAGENVEIHEVALDQQRAALSFDLFLQVRNKVVQAYQEVMRMPL
jgi:flagellar hook-basal body complex protein FliE